MTAIGATSGSPPVPQGQAPPPTAKKTGRDNDGDEGSETAAAKSAEAASQTKHKVDVQA
jgi:hypothetical protein